MVQLQLRFQLSVSHPRPFLRSGRLRKLQHFRAVPRITQKAGSLNSRAVPLPAIATGLLQYQKLQAVARLCCGCCCLCVCLLDLATGPPFLLGAVTRQCCNPSSSLIHDMPMMTAGAVWWRAMLCTTPMDVWTPSQNASLERVAAFVSASGHIPETRAGAVTQACACFKQSFQLGRGSRSVPDASNP